MNDDDKNGELNLFMKAMDEFFRDGKVATRCDVCGEVLQFRALSASAWKHWCGCEKFNGTLKGL